MRSVLNRYATPLITGLFLISLLSGLALYFHIGPAGLHGMHEILSLALVLPFVLHLWKNWRAFAGYFRRLPMAIALAASLVAAVPFLLPAQSSGTGGRPPQFALARAVLAAPAGDVAPLFGISEAELLGRLGSAGYTVADPAQPLADIAAGSGKSETELAALLVAGS